MSKLTDAIRTGTAEALAELFRGDEFLEWGEDRAWPDVHAIAEAIVAAREPEDVTYYWISVREDGTVRNLTMAETREGCERVCDFAKIPRETIRRVTITKEQ